MRHDTHEPRARAFAKWANVALWVSFAGAGAATWASDRPANPAWMVSLALVLALLTASLCTRSHTFRVNAVLSIVGGLLVIYAFEAYHAHRGDRQASMRGEGTFPPGFDRRKSVAVLSDLRSEGRAVWPALNPIDLLRSEGDEPSSFRIGGRSVLPIGSIPRAVILLCNENGTWLLEETDRFGFRNPDSLWDEATVRVALLGDSFTRGYCVTATESFAGRIRQRFSSTLNLGNAGHGPLQWLAALREFLLRKEPDVVVLAYYEGNDFRRRRPTRGPDGRWLRSNFQDEVRHGILRRYLEPGFVQELGGLSAEIRSAYLGYAETRLARALAREAGAAPSATPPRGESERGWLRARTRRLADFLKARRTRQALRLPAFLPPVASAASAAKPVDLDLLTRVLEQIRAEVRAWGGHLLVVYLPDKENILGEGPHSDRAAVLERFYALDLPVVDLLPVFEAHPAPLELFPEHVARGHYSALGHAVVAEPVLDALAGLR